MIKNRLEIRKEYDAKFADIKARGWDQNTMNNMWKTNHSLQLTRFGLFVLQKYAKKNDVPMLRVELQNGRSISELLMIANTMNVPYFITENHVSNKILIQTIESDRTTMLIMNSGNIQYWADMFRDD